jgi:hypothetical protein
VNGPGATLSARLASIAGALSPSASPAVSRPCDEGGNH